ncbi:MAG: ATP-binding protein [Chloroflexota bacterium]|jgi:signal transduction histidine kinase/CheY-like chemotaxis protein
MRADGSVNFILDEILRQIGQVVPYDGACIFLVEDGALRAVASRDLPDLADVTDRAYPLDDALTSQVLSSSQPVVLEDTSKHPDFTGWGRAKDTQSWMGVPLIGRDNSIGYLSLDRRHKTAFTSREAGLAQTFANQAAMTIENARLYDEAQVLLDQTQRQASQLEQLMDLMPDGVLLLDGDFHILHANGAANAYLGQLADVKLGQRLLQLGSEPISSFTVPDAHGSSWHEVTASEPHGVFEASAQPIGASGQRDGWLLLLRNVTAQRKQEGYMRAQERLSTVGQLAAGIAHDFNNTMAIISLYTQLVMRSREIADTDRQRLTIIQGQAQRASELIRQILDFSRQSVVEKKPMDLLPFVREAMRSLHQSLPESIQLQTVFEEEDCFTLGDSGRLMQVFDNLATNAAEAMPDGGQLTFSLSKLSLISGEPFPLPDMSAGDWIRLKVIDSGRGIASQELPRVFEPFYTTKTVGTGTGLGLAQVYGIIKLHDGYIDVDSKIGHGTTFTIYLPAFVPQEERAAPAGDDHIYLGSGETILIVEDDQATREALAEYLSALSYDVRTAGNGSEALQIYNDSEGSIQLVLTDMVMPVMDGATLFARLKQAGSDVKLIAITGYPLDAGIIDLLEQEVYSFIQKPLRVEEVARAIKEALAQGND